MNKKQINSLKLKYDTAADVLFDAEKNARKISLKLIENLVKEISPETSRVEFNDYEGDVDDLYVNVAYDGGNHCEYASNMCSTVYGVFIEKNNKGEDKVFLIIEDCEEYEFERVLTMDILAVTDMLYEIYKCVTENN